MAGRSAVGSIAASILLLLIFAPVVSAFKVLSTPGEGAGQTLAPSGLAVDFESGRLYVADEKNNRVSIFDSEGNFLKTFGWGVDDGSAEMQVCTSSCRKGLAGAAAGQFSGPTAIAVDNSASSPSQHAVYVVDKGNFRVEKFDEEGNFLLTFGSEGSEEGKFTSGSGSEILIGVDPVGTVYVVDTPPSAEKYRLQKFDAAGTLIPSQKILAAGQATGLAVNSVGDFYVSNVGPEPTIRKFSPVGALLEKKSEIAIKTLTIGPANELFAATYQFANFAKESIIEYEALGSERRRFGYGAQRTQRVSGLAPHSSAGGDIYVSAGDEVTQLDFPDPGPVVLPEPCLATSIGNTKATLRAEVNPEGKATTFHFEYISEADFIANGNSFGGPKPATSTTEDALELLNDSGDSEAEKLFKLQVATVKAEGLVPETDYRCRVVAKNASGEATGPEGQFETKLPIEFLGIWTAEVTADSATLNAEVNPLGIPTEGHFEYVDDASFQVSGFDEASEAPDAISFGAGETPAVGSVELSGLKQGTLYHYRIRVSNSFNEAGVFCPEEEPICPGEPPTFRALATSAPGLPDQRRYEQVSPPQKNSAELAVPGSAGGFADERNLRIEAASGSGEAMTYTSWTSFGNPKGAPATNQYLSKRTPDGWSSESISPFGFQRNPFRLPYRGFSPDLEFAGVVVDEPPCAAGAVAEVESLCLRDNATGALQAVTTEVPAVDFNPGERFCSGYAGVSADGKRFFFAANGAMAGALVGKGFSLYEWSAAEGLRLLSVLPGETPAAISEKTTFGAASPSSTPCAMDQSIIRHAVSADGSVVFWTYGGKYLNSERPLLARIGGAETVQLDAKNLGEKNGGKGQFWAASADGSKAIFSAPGKLTPDAKAEGQLYRYDTAARALTNLTPGAVDPEIRGVVGASEDETYVYFVASAALAGAAKAGANNLYLYHEGEDLRFIGALSNLDENAWSSAPATLRARVTPDGKYLAFTSVEAKALAGYDSTIASGIHCQPNRGGILEGDPRCAEAFLYSAEADDLSCVSCNPSGARPAGPTQLPAWSNPFEGPRYLSDDGSRLFFESRDSLISADENQKGDVYEFERAGDGTCTSGSPSFEASSGGCLFLISSGKDDGESYLLDASADGRDVFFSTRAALVGWDTDENYDVYDARIGGGYPEPVVTPICAGEACKPPPVAPPTPPSPSGTATFEGPGTPPANKKKPKGKKKKSKAKKQHHKKRGQARAHRNGRAGR